MQAKICYLSSMTYWFFPIFRLPFLVSPLLYIWFSMKIYLANGQEFFAYTMIYMIGSMMTQSYLYGSVRWTWVSELYEYVQTIYLSRGLISVILNPRKPTFNVTDKGMSLEKDHLSELAIPYFLLFGLFSVSMIACVYRWFAEPDANELLIVVGMWNLFNLLLSGAALGVVTERRTLRVDIDRSAQIAIGSVIAPTKIADISYGGCRIRLPVDAVPQPLREGIAAVLNVPLKRDGGTQSLPVIVSNLTTTGGEISIGFRFPPLKLRHYQVVADLMYTGAGELEAFRAKRRKSQGILFGVYVFIRWGITEPFRGSRFLLAHLRERRANAAHVAGAHAPAPEATLAELAPALDAAPMAVAVNQ